ncbi:MAG: anaerobic ribonucleoside-triphosphate reductase [Candidatus Bathyarchaeia archaeon]
MLKAVSSTVRLHILNLLFDKGALSYTELMNLLKMNPSRDAGRFAYHLKFLLRADLVEADVESKKYRLTELGKMVIDIADEIEKKALRPKRMLVRTSRFALEDFDANKITDSLIKEADMPVELAQKIAKEAEKRLLKAKTKYLTASLIREVVNAILIEKGLEEYRHKLTRLGLPVHDIATLVAKSETIQGSAFIHEIAGKTVLEEYVLLNVLPRDIADAYLSGALHIDGLSYWILKPSEIVHDLRFFFQRGLNLEEIGVFQPYYPPPKNFESALFLVFNVILHSKKEIGETQNLEYFNVFLAPFIKGLEYEEIKETLRLFIFNISQHADVSLGLELVVPDFIAEENAFGPFGKHVGNYGDFIEESQILASLILEIFTEESICKPLFNPKIVVKMRPETFTNEKAKAMLLDAHSLTLKNGILYFANFLENGRKQSVYSTSGYRLDAYLNGDWEIDTLRTCTVGQVIVNLPRIVYECEKDKMKFSEILNERLEMAARALEIKHKTLKLHAKSLLPFLMQGANGDQYLRLENPPCLINLVGLKEVAEAFYEKNIYADAETLKFAYEILHHVLNFADKNGKKHEKRLLSVMIPKFEASERLAKLDIERYGVANVRFLGNREKPYYSTANRILLQNGDVALQSLKTEGELEKLCNGGKMTIVDLGETEHEANELMLFSKRLIENYGIGFFTYNRNLTYCSRCKKSWPKVLNKCLSCGCAGTLATFKRFTT